MPVLLSYFFRSARSRSREESGSLFLHAATLNWPMKLNYLAWVAVATHKQLKSEFH
jgi:hypothetical protein